MGRGWDRDGEDGWGGGDGEGVMGGVDGEDEMGRRYKSTPSPHKCRKP